MLFDSWSSLGRVGLVWVLAYIGEDIEAVALEANSEFSVMPRR